jgi:hypothetical protein
MMYTIQHMLEKHLHALTETDALSAPGPLSDSPSILLMLTQPGGPAMLLCPGKPEGLNFHRPHRPAGSEPAQAHTRPAHPVAGRATWLATVVRRPDRLSRADRATRLLCAGQHRRIQFP